MVSIDQKDSCPCFSCIENLYVKGRENYSSLSHLEFTEVPINTCLPCGGQATFNCTTIANHTVFIDGMIRLIPGPGGQLWRIQTSDGTTTKLYSTMLNEVPPGYGFIETPLKEFTGLGVQDTNSSWSGSTFQCIAFTPANADELNNSSEPVTLEVGGECTICWLSLLFNCRRYHFEF